MISQKYSENILFESAFNDEYHIFLKKLFDFSSLINIKNKLGETVLHHVCAYGMIDKFYALVNMGANIEKTNSQNSLLHYAAYSGKDNFLIVELVKMNILPNEPNKNGITSLHLSANKQIANYLHLWCNRNKSAILELKDHNENSVIHTAKQLGRLDVVEYWIHQYSEFDKLKNIYNQTWHDIPTDIQPKTTFIME